MPSKKLRPRIEFDYAKWASEALATKPDMNRADLARRLGHGTDRARIHRMLNGERRIQYEEVLQIASILGVKPPRLNLPVSDNATASILIEGQIAAGVWIEEGAKRPMRQISIPPRPDPRYPASLQVAYEMGDPCDAERLSAGDYLIAVPISSMERQPAAGDLVVVKRYKADLEQLGLAKAQAGKSGVELSPLTGSSAEKSTPLAIVIGVFRPLG